MYFSSEGVQSGSQANQLGETAQNGQPNLYLEHDGTITFVMNATLIVPPAVAETRCHLAERRLPRLQLDEQPDGL